MPVSRFDVTRFKEEPALGIIRGVTEESLQGVMEAMISGGLRFAEVTLNTPNAASLIKKAAKLYSNSICLGAGTVLSLADAKTAFESGAQFIVSPTLNEEVAVFCKEYNLAYFPGALTPTEIENAWNAGATMVKVFPASQMGSGYFRIIKGPFQNIPLMAVGGMGPGNISEYLSAGADAVALGGSIISASRMNEKKYSLIQNDIEVFLLALRNFYSTMSSNQQ
ncbi:MAG: bifunctional 4-hydroxy-2-oxoglutarate aldolase/2-dehydro-3-deoxy-phosphogluconate aldolase [Nitrospinae bacterium]|nr:bifunctional 4-hydroxy-2-oxoglutarate aldolase/2-dehydro-3-deoxy-phosphogluconate aldolase [Nitrospinota bacterium]MDA1108301.1 bifunctional 4-hydroxy-2-oxoglutarate aldolase/2-dehydro-3-deoxy-phosphogluconate aldolase [Nitrospinota bacterium]